MIPLEFIESWQANAQWPNLNFVEHDLIINKALIDLYSKPMLKENLIFRGGTALNKLFLKPASRYSEDLDFVYTRSEPIGNTLDALRGCLDHWLGKPKRQIKDGNIVTGNQFHKNMLEKKDHPRFRSDMELLLPESARWDFDEAFDFVMDRVISKIP